MKHLKTIAYYLLWTALALLLGLLYLRLIVGAPPDEAEYKGLGYILWLFYFFGMFQLVLIIGGTVAVLFIILDLFYLKKRNYFKHKPILKRSGVLVCILIVVAVIHYVLEKVIDII